MESLVIIIPTAIGCFWWGMYTQEMIQKYGQIKARQNRIVIDAPFSPEQSDTIMNALEDIHKAVTKSMGPKEGKKL